MKTKKYLGLVSVLILLTLLSGVVASSVSATRPTATGMADALSGQTGAQAGFVVGHEHTDLAAIPDEWIVRAKSDLHIAYNHTSHGSQLITGLNALEDFPSFGDKYAWIDDSHGDSSNLSLDDDGIPGYPDLSQGDHDNNGNTYADWADDTYDFLADPDNYHINVILWSWCNISGHDIPRYLNSMEWLIEQFGEGGTHPRAAAHPVQFVFMTAHANGGGEGDSSDSRNEQIRAHVAAHNRILFDFSDIENYDPDDNYFLDKRLDDALYYDSTPPYTSGTRDANWASEFLERHDGEVLDQLTTGQGITGYPGARSCAHSPGENETNDAKLNCVLKGRAVWYLFARLAGWDGGTATGGVVEKTALTSTAVHNQPITYTITISSIPTVAHMSDTLPASLAYVPGSLSATTGVVTDTTAALQWSGDLSGSPAEVTITYAATVNTAATQVITNTAVVTAPGYETILDSAAVLVNGRVVYLPLITR